MAKQITRWEPDTHPGAVIEFEWDDAVPEDARELRPVAARIRGVDIAGPDVEVAFAAVLAQNQRKNNAVGTAVAALPPGVAKGVEDFGFSVDETSGVVTLRVSGISEAQANGMRQQLQARYGGDVVLVIE